MAEFLCQQCHASCEAEETPSTCPICGAAAEEAFAVAGRSARDSVENLFDLEPLNQQPTRSGGEPARLRTNEPEASPLSSSPTLVEGAAGGLQAASTLELEPEPEPEAEPEAPSDSPLKAASTLELDDADLDPATAPPPVPAAPTPPPPVAVPTSTGVSRLDLLTTGRLSSGLSSLSSGLSSLSMLRGEAAAYEAGRETLDLDESDLEQVSEPDAPSAPAPSGSAPPAPTPPAPPAPAAPAPDSARPAAASPAPDTPAAGVAPLVVSPRSLRGRVAFPLRGDQTPSPTTLPKEVNELAVAGEPPMPARRRDRPLTSQTESLSSIQARKRRRVLGMLGIVAIGVAVLGGVVLLARTGDPEKPVTTPVSSVDLSPGFSAPDLAPPPDRALPDVGQPDRARPDQPRRRVVAPVVAGKKLERRRPDAGAAPSASARAEAQATYQEGLRRLLTGQNEEAVRLFNQALTKLPRYSLAYRGLGLAYQKLGRKPMARAAFERYLLLQPGADDADAIRSRLQSLKD